MFTTHLLSTSKLILLCILFSLTKIRNISCSPNFINKSCQTTLYPDLCIKTLSKYANTINTNPKILAVTALAAALNATETTAKVLRNLRRSGAVKPGESEALVECVEVVDDALYELRRSMKELSQTRRGPEFLRQMDDVQTWVSAALTDDDTCMDDFTTVGRIRILVRGYVLTIARLTSICLTFINRYAAV